MHGLTKRRVSLVLESISDAAMADTQRLADMVREQYVLPACRKHGLEFLSGMGSWTFHRDNPKALYGSDIIEEHDAGRYGLARVFGILKMATVWRDQTLGDWVGSVRKEDY